MPRGESAWPRWSRACSSRSGPDCVGVGPAATAGPAHRAGRSPTDERRGGESDRGRIVRRGPGGARSARGVSSGRRPGRGPPVAPVGISHEPDHPVWSAPAQRRRLPTFSEVVVRRPVHSRPSTSRRQPCPAAPARARGGVSSRREAHDAHARASTGDRAQASGRRAAHCTVREYGSPTLSRRARPVPVAPHDQPLSTEERRWPCAGTGADVRRRMALSPRRVTVLRGVPRRAARWGRHGESSRRPRRLRRTARPLAAGQTSLRVCDRGAGQQ